ncbi:hypothetical protein EZV62_005721 [Acer yangbiense]|uniref:Peptidase M48 domain-containing protein n=1 Tax=Acer yangbiense TaxID=1000413 RepID=A0A5C7IQN9_9ROSI|nr:hypothetical protein EZV62_005721 [Acer yangbiense]
MNFYRRARFASDAFRDLSSRIVTRAPVQEPTSRILQNGSSNAAKFSGFSSYSCFSKRLGFSVGSTSKNYCNSVNDIIIGKRYFSVDRYWLENLTSVLVAFGAAITFYFRHLETVPYTNRTRFVIMSKATEKRGGESQFQHWKASFKDKILPATHQDSVRVMLISKEIIEALQRELSLENVGSVMYASSDTDEGRAHDTSTEGGEGRIEVKLGKEDQILQHTRKKGQEKWFQATTSHLEGLNWEVLVVNKPVVEAVYISGGKIVVFTGLLEHFGTDEELATIIGHEVGHAVARHVSESLTRNVLFVDSISILLSKPPFTQKREMEADYIGLMLLASAGYDPRVVPKVYEKLDQFPVDNLLYPSGKKRAQMLAQAKVMEEALSIYREIRPVDGRGAVFDVPVEDVDLCLAGTILLHILMMKRNRRMQEHEGAQTNTFPDHKISIYTEEPTRFSLSPASSSSVTRSQKLFDEMFSRDVVFGTIFALYYDP